MPQIRLLNLTAPGIRAIHSALELLRRLAPEHHWHLYREIKVIAYQGPDACGPSAIACTAGTYGRQIALTSPPEEMDLIELSVTLSHESRHHFTDAWGRYRTLPHECRDCTDPAERATDCIYQEDDRLRARLRMSLGWSRPSMQRPPAWPASSPLSPPRPDVMTSLLPRFGAATIRQPLAPLRDPPQAALPFVIAIVAVLGQR